MKYADWSIVGMSQDIKTTKIMMCTKEEPNTSIPFMAYF